MNATFTHEQKEYLAGLFAGVAARGQTFNDVEPAKRRRKARISFLKNG